MSEVLLCAYGGNKSWQVWVSLRGNTKMAESKMAKFKMAEFKMAAIIKLSENKIELVWVRVRVEWECFWVNLREDNKVSESKMAVSESNMAEFKMAAIIKWVRMNEWSVFVQMAESKMVELKMAAIMKLSENEWDEVFFLKMAQSKMAEFKMADHLKLIRMN